jgi:septum site-determining protein MinC
MGQAKDGAAVGIKGTGEGLIITLGQEPFEQVLGELEARLASRASFFLGGRVALRVGTRSLSEEQLLAVGALVEGHGMTLWAVESDHPETHVAARELGLETSLRTTRPTLAPEQLPLEEMPGIVVRRTLRSGQVINHVGHVTLIGDVNPGAEVVAGGDVIVWGKLRGTVHAGAMGDESAVVCALLLAPSQIRIGALIARAPERSRLPDLPEMAFVQEDEGIILEAWASRLGSCD